MATKSKALTSQKGSPKTVSPTCCPRSPPHTNLCPGTAVTPLFLPGGGFGSHREISQTKLGHHGSPTVASSALTQSDPSTNNASLGEELLGPQVGFLSGLLLLREPGTNGR